MYFQPFDGLVLSLGVEKSRRYASAFTGSFYLGRTFSWSLASKDYPAIGYRRLGHFLEIAELPNLGLEAFGAENVDYWWTPFTLDCCARFADAVELSLPRFLSQPKLTQVICESKLLLERLALVETVRRSIQGSSGSVPKREARLPMGNDVQPIWYVTAETALKGAHSSIPTKVGIISLAEDAWCCERFLVAGLGTDVGEESNVEPR